MASEHPLDVLIDAVELRYRDHLTHHQTLKDWLMKYLADLIADRKTLIGDIATQTARAEAAEAKVADLEGQIAADEAEAKKALEDDKAADAGGKVTAPVVTTTGDGATVTVNPAVGLTTHEAEDGTVTTVDHADGGVTAVNASGMPVSADPAVAAAAAAATEATVAAGVTVLSAA